MKNLLGFCALAGLVSLSQAQTAADSNLRVQATLRGINIGAAVTFPSGNNAANRPAYDSALSQNYNILVPENAMKIANTENVRGTFTFTAADAIVDFAEAHGQKMRGHTLVWHSQAGFMANLNVPRDTMLAVMKNHINTVMGRYKGRILEWDVVNEAIGQNGAPSPNIRQSFWVTRIGVDFIDSAFVFAHRVDSNAFLYYNDFGGESMNDADANSKSKNVYDLVKGLKERGIPIHGVGLQSHLSGNFDTNAIGNNMRRLAALGLRISITELDIPINANDSASLADQKKKYKSLMALCISVPACKTYMAWGVNDAQSWLGANKYALLFSGTATLTKKPAYFGLVEALREAGPAPVLTVPGAPTGVTLSLDTTNPSGGVKVTWTSPASNGGTAITGYKVMRIPDTTKFCTTTGALTCKLSGLAPSDSVTVYVRATNAVGPGPLSAPSSKFFIPVSLSRGSVSRAAGAFGSHNSYRLSPSEISRTEDMTLAVSDITGRTVWQKMVHPAAANSGEISWNGTGLNGRAAAPGIYVLRVKTTSAGVTRESVGKGMKLP